MRVDLDKVRRRAAARGSSMRRVLAEAGVSVNAFYRLARKPSVMPPGLVRVAAVLGTDPDRLLARSVPPEQQVARQRRRLARVLKRHPEANADHVRHTLILLDEPPLDRLRRALRRGRRVDLR